MDNRTEVGKTNATIKKILAATVGDRFKGRRVEVVEVTESFSYDIYLEMGSPTIAFIASADGSSAHAVRPPSMAQPTVTLRYDLLTDFPDGRSPCIVVYHRGGSERVSLYIPKLDSATLSIVTDALLEGNKRDAAAAASQFGAYAGVAMAVAEAHAKSLKKGQAYDGDLTAASVSTSTKPGAARAKKSADQLNREIEAVIGRRLP